MMMMMININNYVLGQNTYGKLYPSNNNTDSFDQDISLSYYNNTNNNETLKYCFEMLDYAQEEGESFAANHCNNSLIESNQFCGNIYNDLKNYSDNLLINCSGIDFHLQCNTLKDVKINFSKMLISNNCSINEIVLFGICQQLGFIYSIIEDEYDDNCEIGNSTNYYDDDEILLDDENIDNYYHDQHRPNHTNQINNHNTTDDPMPFMGGHHMASKH